MNHQSHLINEFYDYHEDRRTTSFGCSSPLPVCIIASNDTDVAYITLNSFSKTEVGLELRLIQPISLPCTSQTVTSSLTRELHLSLN